MSDLKPCPFCGGEAKTFQHGDVGYIVQCRRCGIWNAGYHAAWSHITEDEFNGFVDEETAIAAWNARAERTCKSTTDDSAWCFVCSECEKSFPRNKLYLAHNHGEINYCPNCGAKVVDA